MTRGIDFAPLTAPVTRAEVSAFRASAHTRYPTASTTAQTVVLTLFAVVFGIVALTFVGSLIQLALPTTVTGVASQAISAAVTVGLLAVVVTGGILLGRGLSRRRWERLFRLDAFASANSMTYSPCDSAPQYPGAIFSSGHSRQALDHLRSINGRFLDYGNYRYVTGSGKNQSTHNWGFLALQLDRALPHMVLDSRANNGLFGATNLPSAFQKEQVLSLEGDFDDYFTLYCPREYERDALYIFTPDLMALLIDNAAPFDVEIIDQWMFVYSARAFDMVEPDVHRRLLGIIDTVGEKTLTQTDNYSDDRMQDFRANAVAPEGRRLRRRFPLAAVILTAVVVIVFVVGPWITDTLAILGR